MISSDSQIDHATKRRLQKKSKWPVNQSTLQKENHKNISCLLRYSTVAEKEGFEPSRRLPDLLP